MCKEKKCPRCGKVKPLSEFHKGTGKCGVNTYCIECRTGSEYVRVTDGPSQEERRVMAEQEKRWCGDCNDWQPFDAFHNPKTSSYCKKHFNKRNRDKAYEKKKFVIGLLGGMCQRPGCEYTNLSGLEAHHVNEKEKEADLWKIKSIDNMLKEADLCCLFCSNHHKEFHASDWSCEFVKSDDLGYTVKEVSL